MEGMLVRLAPVTDDCYPQLAGWISGTSAGVLANGAHVTCSSAEELRRFMAADRASYAILQTRAAGENVGLVSWRTQAYPDSYEIGGLVGDENLWDSGLGVEGGLLLCDYLFRQRGAHRIELMVAEVNRRTLQFLIRGEMAVEAVLRDHLFVDGRYTDAIVCSLLRADYDAPFNGYLPPSTPLVAAADRSAAARRAARHLAGPAADHLRRTLTVSLHPEGGRNHV